METGSRHPVGFDSRPFGSGQCQGFPLHVFTEARAEMSGEGWRGQDPLGDLHGLLTEIQALRAQLERSIETNSTLQSKLEEQLARGGQKAQEAVLTLGLQTLSAPERPLQQNKPGTALLLLTVGNAALCVCELLSPGLAPWRCLPTDSRPAIA